MKENREEKTIHNMYEKIDTPEYDAAGDVMRHIHSAPRRNIALRRVVIIAAVVCLCAAAIGAAELLGWQSFNLFGEKTGGGLPKTVSVTPIPEDPSVVQYDDNFLSGAADDEIRLITSQDGAGRYSEGGNSGMQTDDFNKISGIIENSKSPITMPGYIPEGYTFHEGSINFYIDEAAPAELISSEQRNGKTYMVYKLQDGFEENVRLIKLTYVNKKGEKLIYHTHLTEALTENIEHYVSENAVVKHIEVQSFDAGIWIHDKTKEFYLNAIELCREISPISAIDIHIASMYPGDEAGHAGRDRSFSYLSLVYFIQADSLEADELTKIAESIN